MNRCLIVVLIVAAVGGCARTGGIRFTWKGEPPKVYVGEVQVEAGGALDKEIVARYIHGWRAQVKHCHRQALQRRPGLEGMVRARWVILPTGLTTGASIVESTVNDPIMESCIIHRIQAWKFPSTGDGAAVQVTYPFKFVDDEPIPQPATIVVPPQLHDTDGDNTEVE